MRIELDAPGPDGKPVPHWFPKPAPAGLNLIVRKVGAPAASARTTGPAASSPHREVVSRQHHAPVPSAGARVLFRRPDSAKCALKRPAIRHRARGVPPGVDRPDGAPGRAGRARVPPRAGLDSLGGGPGPRRGAAHGALPPQPSAPRRWASPSAPRPAPRRPEASAVASARNRPDRPRGFVGFVGDSRASPCGAPRAARAAPRPAPRRVPLGARRPPARSRFLGHPSVVFGRSPATSLFTTASTRLQSRPRGGRHAMRSGGSER